MAISDVYQQPHRVIVYITNKDHYLTLMVISSNTLVCLSQPQPTTFQLWKKIKLIGWLKTQGGDHIEKIRSTHKILK